MSDTQAKWIFRAHKLCMRLQAKHPLIAALGGTGLNMLMSYSYMMVLRQGAIADGNEKMS